MRAVIVGAWIAVGCGGHLGPEAQLESISVEPANATITSDGTPTSLDYTVIGHYTDGRTAAIPDATLSLDTHGTRLGQFTGAQLVTHGRAAGKGGVVAMSGDLVATTGFIVVVHRVDLGPGVPPDAATLFPDAPPIGAQSPTIAYPLDNAHMPSSVKAPDVQWESSNQGQDLYRVRMTAGDATLDTIVSGQQAPFNFNSQPRAEDWRLVLDSSFGAIRINVDHWDPVNGAHGSTPVTVKIIDANITGTIYYWNLFQGQMERIDDVGRAVAIQNPPPAISDGSTRCVACHTVSRDGRYLSASIGHAGDQKSGVFDMSDPQVATADPAPTLSAVDSGSYRALFTTFNHDATRLLVNADAALSLVDPRTGAAVSTNGTPLPTTNASHPAWSPDGSTIAFINNINSAGWAVDYTAADLAVIPASAGDTFGPAQTIVPTAAGPFAAPSWPSFAPDSEWIAYGAGTNARGKDGATEHPGALFLVHKNGGSPRRLDAACGGALRCYLPNFSPYDTNGYFWLVFYSFRDYGNAQAGTKGTGRRQMWITAIKKSDLINTTGDPSMVPYWVPDQDRATENMSAFWALPPPLL